MNLSTNFRGLPLKVEMTLSRLKDMNSVLYSFEGQCLLLLALGYAVGIWLEQVYLQEVLDHLCSLYLL